MASIGADPVIANPADAREALERDLPLVLRGVPFEQSGWVRPETLTLLVPLWGAANGDAPDLYLLRLNFAYYPEWPPSARFINPVTRGYEKSGDLRWLPKIEGTNRIAVHADYNGQGQLICSSTTLEFYAVRHGVEGRDLWSPENQNFAATINAVREGLSAPYYRGRLG